MKKKQLQKIMKNVYKQWTDKSNHLTIVEGEREIIIHIGEKETSV